MLFMHYERGGREIPVRNMSFRYDEEYGQLLKWDYLAESEDDLLMLLREEKRARAGFAVGDIPSYLVELG